MESHDPNLQRRSTDRLKAHEEPFDPASGLAQRSLFRARCERAWEWAQKEHIPASVLFVHVGGYDDYLTRCGQVAADALIHAVAEAIRESCRRRADFAGRLRPDEFAITLTDVGQKGTLKLANDIRQRTRAEALAEAGIVHAGAILISIGAACQIPPAHKFAQSLLIDADSALQRAIAAGNGQIVASFETA